LDDIACVVFIVGTDVAVVAALVVAVAADAVMLQDINAA
jgi:hypothetical protein